MDQQDPEQRIAELERELAQQKRIAELERQLAEAKASTGDPVQQPIQVSAGQLDAIDDHARRLAQALQADRAQSFGPGAAPLREALARAVVEAGLSQEQYKDVLARAGLRAGGTIKIGSQVVYQRCDPSDPVFLAPGGRGAYAYGGYGVQGGFPRRGASSAGPTAPGRSSGCSAGGSACASAARRR